MRCTTIRVSPVPQHELPPTAHPIAKKIAALLQHDGSCCLFGSISEVANFLWQTQEFVFGSQTVQASELIDPDTVTEPQYEGHLTLEDGTEATLVLSDGGQPSLSSCVGLCMKYQSSSDILQGSLSIRMGSVTRTTLSEARWTFVGVDDAAEVASAIEDVYVRCDDTEVALNLDVLKSAHADPAEVSVELHGVTIRFVAQIEVEKMPPPSPRPNMSGEDDCQWRLSIEVRSLKLRVSPAKVFAKYSYPFLEQTRPFRTNPPVMARKNTTIHFPHSFSSYHFPRKKESDIRRAFADMLRIEVWQRETYTADSMVGHAFFDITPIFEQPLKHDSSKPSMGHGYRLLDLISSVEFDNESKGVLRVVVFIENLGVISPPSPPPSARQNLEPTVVTPKELDELRDTPAYSSAVELELWKRNEEAKFRVRLQEEERQKKRQLEEEYEEKERVRSLEFHSQKQQMVKVEQTLRLKLQEVMKREQQLQAVTVKIKTEKAITERQQQITKEQAALETKLLRHEMDQNLKLDHSKCKKLNAKVENIEEDLNLWRQRYTELEEKFIAYRKSVVDSESPIEQLKADIKIKEFEIEDLLRKNAVIAASRDHFKQAVRTLLMELEKERKTHYATNVPTPQQYLNGGLAVGRPPSVDGGCHSPDDVTAAFQQIKKDLAQLREASQSPQPASRAVDDRATARKDVSSNHAAGAWEEIRQELLASGLYTERDRMFKYLKDP